jgi:hypothetical protein
MGEEKKKKRRRGGRGRKKYGTKRTLAPIK